MKCDQEVYAIFVYLKNDLIHHVYSVLFKVTSIRYKITVNIVLLTQSSLCLEKSQNVVLPCFYISWEEKKFVAGYIWLQYHYAFLFVRKDLNRQYQASAGV